MHNTQARKTDTSKTNEASRIGDWVHFVHLGNVREEIS